jgi:hypothetical protein
VRGDRLSGGAHYLPPGREAYAVQERWGHPTRMMPSARKPLLTGTAEGRAWRPTAHWAATWRWSRSWRSLSRAAGRRRSSGDPRENGKVLSMLLFLSPASFNAERFFDQVAEILSRNLSMYLQRKAAERRLTHRSLHDALTDLPNRVYLTHQLETRLARLEPAAVLYIDLDRYKIINDTGPLGRGPGAHRSGDPAARVDPTAGRRGPHRWRRVHPAAHRHLRSRRDRTHRPPRSGRDRKAVRADEPCVFPVGQHRRAICPTMAAMRRC